jgi:multiple sugar transport system substrate-binding protein
VESGYLPVTTAANDMDAIRASGLELTDNMEQTLSGAVKTVRENELYTPMAFADGTAARKILEYSMGDQASADRDTVLERIAAGQSAEAATAEFLTDDYFEAWYQATLAQLQQYEG